MDILLTRLVSHIHISEALAHTVVEGVFHYCARKLYSFSVKQYTAATAKERFSRLFDAAERGEPVIIERRGVRFRVQTDQQLSRK